MLLKRMIGFGPLSRSYLGGTVMNSASSRFPIGTVLALVIVQVVFTWSGDRAYAVAPPVPMVQEKPTDGGSSVNWGSVVAAGLTAAAALFALFKTILDRRAGMEAFSERAPGALKVVAMTGDDVPLLGKQGWKKQRRSNHRACLGFAAAGGLCLIGWWQLDDSVFLWLGGLYVAWAYIGFIWSSIRLATVKGNESPWERRASLLVEADNKREVLSKAANGFKRLNASVTKVDEEAGLLVGRTRNRKKAPGLEYEELCVNVRREDGGRYRVDIASESIKARNRAVNAVNVERLLEELIE